MYSAISSVRKVSSSSGPPSPGIAARAVFSARAAPITTSDAAMASTALFVSISGFPGPTPIKFTILMSYLHICSCPSVETAASLRSSYYAAVCCFRLLFAAFGRASPARPHSSDLVDPSQHRI